MRVGVMVGSRFRGKVAERQVFGDNSVARKRMKGHGKESSVAEESREESEGRVKRRRAGELQSGDGGKPEAPGKKRRQSKKGVVPSSDG